MLGWSGNGLTQDVVMSIHTMEQHARPLALFQHRLGRSFEKMPTRAKDRRKRECFGLKVKIKVQMQLTSKWVCLFLQRYLNGESA